MLYLVSLLYVLPSYFRRLDELVSHLESNLPDVYLDLGKPSLSLLDSSIRSTSSLVMFVLRKQYLTLNDSVTSKLGNAARWRIIYFMFLCVIPLVAGARALILSLS